VCQVPLARCKLVVVSIPHSNEYRLFSESVGRKEIMLYKINDLGFITEVINRKGEFHFS
jgi:hypothetical protein